MPIEHERDIIFEHEEDAESILKVLKDRVKTNKHVTLSEFRILCGLPANIGGTNIVWLDLSGAGVKETSDGWIIDFPGEPKKKVSKVVEHLLVELTPVHYRESQDRRLEVSVRVNGRKHFTRTTASANDLTSWFDEYWRYLGETVKNNLNRETFIKE